MFNNILGNKKASKTCFFKCDNETLIDINDIPGNGSINSCIESLGFAANHVKIVHTFDSDKISCLGFKSLSKQLVMVLTKSPQTKISYSDVRSEIKRIDWDFEYSSLAIEDILQEGIDLQNLDFSFLKSVIELKDDGENVFKSDQLGLYFQFNKGMLKAFASTGWDNSATKWLNDLNPKMVTRMKEEAQRYHANDIDTMEEVNNQAKAILGIPKAIGNEFIPLHTKKNGNVNFYNLLITHYNENCSVDDFLFMNKGRLSKINENTIEVGRFIYSFTSDGWLESAFEK
ncbi:hypothetical protein ACTHQF_01090 [Pedobacter sp. SAFR-022]|uniref:hypothetical protein n=1 Tax=Pedobacter sp. SAFR-022 TaxID=3436861 RepID=UPI003F8138B3